MYEEFCYAPDLSLFTIDALQTWTHYIEIGSIMYTHFLKNDFENKNIPCLLVMDENDITRGVTSFVTRRRQPPNLSIPVGIMARCSIIIQIPIYSKAECKIIKNRGSKISNVSNSISILDQKLSDLIEVKNET